jgi:ABC-type Fe3+-hydroxamate transport system substrate-binding protein
VVSLSPGITETVIALGKAEALVGLSDYCSWKAKGAPEPPHVGSAITPNYEAIARLQPTLILASEVAGDQLKPLNRLAPTHSLPWLTLGEFTGSITTLGQLIHAEEEARALAERISRNLEVRPPKGAPKILLALDYGDSGTNETWFIRRNSIHGAVLHAAGAQNAVERDISGPPKLSPEQLLALDPDAIIVLRSSAKDPAVEARSLAHFKRWAPLRAVRENRIRVLSIEGSLAVGPAVLELTTHLKQTIDEVMSHAKVAGP